MTIAQKMNFYTFDTPERRQWAMYLLTQAAYQGKDLAKIVLVFDRFGGVSLLEAPR